MNERRSWHSPRNRQELSRPPAKPTRQSGQAGGGFPRPARQEQSRQESEEPRPWQPKWRSQAKPPWRPRPARAFEPRPPEEVEPYVPGVSPRLLRPQINPLDVAAAVIRKADREHPADAVLREELRANGAIYRSQSAEVSRAVFAYYRWFGWLDQRHPLAGQIKHALDLATAFAERPDSFSDEKLMQRCLPAWIAAHMEVTADWVRSLQREPSLWIRARRGFTAALRKSLVKTAKSPLPEALRYAGKEDLFRRPEFQDGEFEIQDIASQVVSLLCDPQPGETWWDACAGEGGKTLHLSDLMQNKGLIWASDRADWRLKRLKLRTGRAKCFNYRTVFWDGGEKPPTKTKFDGVLVDAPCAGLGTWQRNPHARWTLTLDDVRELAAIQKTLLSHVAGSVKPGGKLLYAVCTLSREETTEVAKFADEQLADFEPLPLPDLLHAGGPAAPVRWFWPQDLGGNGMFVAAWRRRSAAVKDPSPTPGTSSTP